MAGAWNVIPHGLPSRANQQERCENFLQSANKLTSASKLGQRDAGELLVLVWKVLGGIKKETAKGTGQEQRVRMWFLCSWLISRKNSVNLHLQVSSFNLTFYLVISLSHSGNHRTGHASCSSQDCHICYFQILWNKISTEKEKHTISFESVWTCRKLSHVVQIFLGSMLPDPSSWRKCLRYPRRLWVPLMLR